MPSAYMIPPACVALYCDGMAGSVFMNSAMAFWSSAVSFARLRWTGTMSPPTTSKSGRKPVFIIPTIWATDQVPMPVSLSGVMLGALPSPAASGAPQVGQPGSNGLGGTIGGALEASNVNTVEELVNMIETQRAYEINSKAISTVDRMLEYANANLGR